MSFRSHAPLWLTASLAVVLAVSACSDDRPAQLSEVQTIDIPVADSGPQANQNISNPTLEMPVTYPVADGDELTLVWSEDFDGPEIDPEVWFFESADGCQYSEELCGWGNNELQYYLPDNAMIVNGVLEITARREMVGGLDYTSARINTEDRFAFKYGRIEASIKLPAGQGVWPAFWMLSQDSAYDCEGRPCNWAATGEIDIMEAVNLDGTGGNEIYGTLHYGGEAPGNTFTGDTYSPSVDVTDDFHTYALEWDEFEMRWYFDGQLYSIQNSWFSTAAPYPAPFDQPFHILLNVAVGGNFPGSPDGSTPFPVTMAVDWVRVYSGEESMGPPVGAGIIPDDVIYASDPNETVDIVFGFDYADFTPFGSGSTFNNNVTTDADFNPAFGVTTGNGYDAQVGQFALVGFATGIASGYATLDFKAKGLNEDVIRVKLVETADSNYVDITLTSSQFATDLGNGWYQVSVPITSFGNAATADGLLFETGGTAPANAYTFLLTDFGFSGTAGGGGGDGDTGGGTVLVTFDEVTPPVVTDFGGAVSVIEPGPAGGDGNSLNIVRNGGDVFAGAWVAIPAIPSDAGTQTVSALVYSPMAGIPMVAKAEFDENAGTGDVQANEVVVVGWQTLTWTFTNLDPAQSYIRFTMLPNLGTVDMPATSYFFDNITLLDAAGGGGDGGGGGGGGGGGTGEIAVNGGFESGDFSGWETFPGGGSQAITTDNPSTGTYAVNLTVPVRTQTDPPVDNVIKIANLQAGNLTPGAAVTVSFDMRGSLSGVGGVVFAELFSELSGGGTSKAEILSGGPLTPVTAWTSYSFTTTLGPDVSGGVSLQLKASCGPVEGCGVDVFFDNVSIVIGDGGDTGGGDTGGGGDGEELAINGDFETGDLTGWTADSTTGGLIEVVDTGASGGTYAAHLVAGATQSPLIKQVQLAAGAVMPNSTVTVSFDMKGTITGVGGVVFAEFFSEGNPVAQQFLGGGPITPTAEWATYTYTVTTGPDVSQGITLQFVAVCGAEECGVDVFFDNVSITAVLGDAGGGGDPGVAGGSCGGSEEQASNCDFESGDLTGWTGFVNGGLIEVVDTGTGAGASAANLVAGPSNNPLIKQFELAAGAVTPGDTVNISFDMRGTLSGEGGVVFAEFFSEGDETTGEILTGGPIFPTFSWATYTYTVTAGADVSRGITFQLAAVCGAVAGCGVDVFFDNVSIVIPGVDGTGGGGGGDTGGTEPTVAAPTPTEAAIDVVSLFSNAYSNVRIGVFSTIWDDADVSDIQVAGDDVKKYVPTEGGTSLGSIAITFENSFAIDGTGYDTLRMDIWTPDVTNLQVRLSDFGGDGLAGANADSTGSSTRILTQGSWQTISIPFSEFMTNGLMGVTELSQIVLQDLDGASGGTTLYVDNLYFFNSAGSGSGGGGAGDTVLVTFDEVTPPVVTEFGGAVATIEAGPVGGGSDATLKVLRDGVDARAGATVFFPNGLVSGPGTQTISAEFYSPTAGIPVVAVLAYGGVGTGDVLQNETVVVGWQTLTWTFTDLNDADYDRIAFVPNEGTADTAMSYFFDNITLLDGGGTVLVTFDEVTPPVVTEFGGAVATIEAGPVGGGSDATLKVLRDGVDARAGATVFFPNGLVSGPGTQTISAEFYSPTAGIPVVAVLAYGGVGTGDVLQNETVVVGWQTLTWTFTDLNDADYDRIAFVPNEGTADTAMSYFFDNITLIGAGAGAGAGGGGGGEVALATFDEVPPPVVTFFGGAAFVIETGPAGGGGGNALKIVRNGGDDFAGAWVAIPAIPSDAGTQTVSALVYSPTAGIPMVAKAEYGENTGTGDVPANETVVMGWQTLTWTFTDLDPAEVYNRFVMLPNRGTVDIAATSYFFDNITLIGGGG